MNQKYSIAVIDDEKSIQQTLSYALPSNDYNVSFYDSANSALEQIPNNVPDLIILDIMMPGIDGITFCSIFRKNHPGIPIIFLTSRTDELTKIEALERGGDDYMTKPFSIKELLVRISVCLRRVEQFQKQDINSADNTSDSVFVVDYPKWRVLVRDHELNFSVSEFRIFTALYKSPGVVFTREKLMEAAYPEDSYISDRNVDMHIARIRKKINAQYPQFNGLEAVYGLGYRFIQEQL